MALVGVLCAEVKPETVGAVRSMVIVVVALVADVGPELGGVAVSETEFAFKRGTRVPSLQPVIVTVKLVPLLTLGANVQPVAVPAFTKPLAVSPIIDSDMVNE